MNDLSDKLEANDCRQSLERLLPSLPACIRSILEVAIVSSLSADLPIIFYPTWKDGQLTTTRGDNSRWSHLQLFNLSAIRKHLKDLRFPEGTTGYFFFGQSYPYFKVDLSNLQQHIDELLEFAAQNKHPDLVFVTDNSGIIIEYDDEGYEVSWWGL